MAEQPAFWKLLPFPRHCSVPRQPGCSRGVTLAVTALVRACLDLPASLRARPRLAAQGSLLRRELQDGQQIWMLMYLTL